MWLILCNKHNIYGQSSQEGQNAWHWWQSQISSKSIKPRPKYSYSRFFKMAAVRHLGFLKVGNFNLRPVRRPNMRHHAKFIEDRSNHSGDMVIFDFARWRPPPYWIFDILNFELLERSRGSIGVILRNFIEIGQTTAEIWLFIIFQDGGRPPSWIFTSVKF